MTRLLVVDGFGCVKVVEGKNQWWLFFRILLQIGVCVFNASECFSMAMWCVCVLECCAWMQSMYGVFIMAILAMFFLCYYLRIFNDVNTSFPRLMCVFYKLWRGWLVIFGRRWPLNIKGGALADKMLSKKLTKVHGLFVFCIL